MLRPTITINDDILILALILLLLSPTAVCSIQAYSHRTNVSKPVSEATQQFSQSSSLQTEYLC